VQQRCDNFLQFLIDAGIKNYRHGIVLAVAEKLNTMIVGIYDGAELEGEHK